MIWYQHFRYKNVIFFIIIDNNHEYEYEYKYNHEYESRK